MKVGLGERFSGIELVKISASAEDRATGDHYRVHRWIRIGGRKRLEERLAYRSAQRVHGRRVNRQYDD
jgi:hypothetical protein